MSRALRAPALWAPAIALLALTTVLIAAPRTATAGSGGSWELVSKDDGVRVSRKQVPGSNMFAFRGVMTANVHFAKVVQVFADSKSRRHWVDRWHSDKELSVKSPLERTYYIRFGLPFPVSDRDYVLHTKAKPNPKRRILTAYIKSVNHPAGGKKSCCVRGNVVGTYYKFEALPNSERTRLTVEVHTDPRGMLPAWLVNIIQKKWPYKTLRGLVRQAQKPGTPKHPRFADWHTPYVAPAPPAPPAPAAPAAPPAAPAPPATSRPTK